MALKFITGRSGSGKSTLALQEIADKQAENTGNNLILIVPEQFSLQAEKDIIRLTAGKGILAAKVLTFHRLAHTVFKETGNLKGKPFNDISHAIALKKVILDNRENLTYFHSAVEKKGFLDQLTLTINEFFSYHIGTEKIQALQQELPPESIVGQKLSDLITLYQGYKNFLSQGYIAGEESLDILYNRMDDSQIIRGAEIWLDGYYGFTPQELGVIEKLMVYAKDVTVCLTIDDYSLNKKELPMSHTFYEPKETYLALSAIAKRQGVPQTRPRFLEGTKRFRAKALAALEKEFTLHLIQKQQDYKGLHLFAGKNIFHETEYTAAKILTLVREEGYHFKDIAVLAGELNDYENTLSNYFAQCGIPFFMDSKREIESHPFTALVKGILEIALYNFSFDSVFSFLKTDLVPFERETVEILENYCLQYGIKGYRWQGDNWTYGFTEENQGDRYLLINGLRRQILDCLEPITGLSLRKKYAVSQISKNLIQALETMGVPEKLEQMTGALNEAGDMAKASETKQCWSIFIEIIESLDEILPDMKITLKEYHALIESGFSQGKLGIIPPSIDNVIIGNLERTRLPKVKALFLLGVNDGVIPSNRVAEGILANEERMSLEDKGFNLSHNAVRLAFEENFIIYQAVTKSEENLFISYSTGDLSGGEKLPSPIVSKIRKIFPALPLETELTTEDKFAVPALAFQYLGRELRQGNGGIWAESLEFFTGDTRWQERTKLLSRGLLGEDPPQRLSPDTIAQAFGKDLYSSVSRLEKFAACPYSYFLSYTMKAEERKIYTLRTPDLGLLFHGVLENFANRLKEEGLDWSKITYEQAMRLVYGAVDIEVPRLSNEILLSSNSMQYLIQRLKRICLRSIWTLHKHLKHGRFQPYAYELDFGNGGVLPPIAIDLKDGGQMYLSGKIDRVDILKADGESFVKIIDYKSGSKDFSLKDVYYGLQLQLLIYLDSLIKNGNLLFKENLLPGGVFYFRIKDPMISAEDSITTEAIEELISEKLKMSGLILNHPSVLTGLDNTGDKKSKIVPIEYGREGLSKKSAVVDGETYEAVKNYAVETAAGLGARIKEGDISVSPYKSKDSTPCSYCAYKSVCGFEEDSGEYSPRRLGNLNDDKVLEIIKGGEEKAEE